MLKLAIGVIVGATIGVLGTLMYDHVNSRDAYHQGQIDLGLKVPKALGSDIDPHEPMEHFSSVEVESVVVVNRNGVKTLRICCDGTEPTPTR